MQRWRYLLGILVICCGVQTVPGQRYVQQGAGEPTLAQTGSWYFNTEDHLVWKRRNGNWNLAKLGYTVKLMECGKIVGFFNGEEWHLYDGASCEYLDYGQDFECLPGLTRVEWSTTNRFYMDTTLVAWNWLKVPGSSAPRQKLLPDTLGGIPAYCATAYVGPKRTIMDFTEAHAWGMLGTNGVWLIEPKYDKQFTFKMGVAEVLLYGEKLKINTKGEVVP